ncbi:MAG TPA: hypothetical protein VHG93_16690 [Longimicrobium sp.]|nr:hypothetical protein [Longimicrobium sp.]
MGIEYHFADTLRLRGIGPFTRGADAYLLHQSRPHLPQMAQTVHDSLEPAQPVVAAAGSLTWIRSAG